MRALLVVMLAAGTAAAEPNEIALRAGWTGVGYSGGSADGPFIELEGELRGPRIGAAAAFGVLSYAHGSGEGVRVMSLALRLRYHADGRFFGVGMLASPA